MPGHARLDAMILASVRRDPKDGRSARACTEICQAPDRARRGTSHTHSPGAQVRGVTVTTVPMQGVRWRGRRRVRRSRPATCIGRDVLGGRRAGASAARGARPMLRQASVEHHPAQPAGEPRLVFGSQALGVVQAADGDINFVGVVLGLEGKLGAALGTE